MDNLVYAVEFTSYINHLASNGEIWNGTTCIVDLIPDDETCIPISQYSRSKGYELVYFKNLIDVMHQIGRWNFPVDKVEFTDNIPITEIASAKQIAFTS